MTASQRAFLAKVISWPMEGEDGWVNIHWKDAAKQGNIAWSGRACKTIDEAISNINWILSTGTRVNVYACMSRQSKMELKTSAKGNVYNKVIRFIENATHFKSFWLDVDYKNYTSPEETFDAVRMFLEKSNIPSPSLLLKSGGGLQVYWTLSQSIEPVIWVPMAHALAEAARRFELRADTACTVDAARILRVPDTTNYKYNPPEPVVLEWFANFDYSLDRIGEALLPYKVTVPPPAEGKAPVSDLSAGIERPKARPVKIKNVALECGFIREAVLTGGAKYTQPMWMLTTLAATFMEHGRECAHIMGKDHPGYSVETTDELFNRKEKEKATKNIGWPTCKTIANSGSKVCGGCPHFIKHQSPLNHARKEPEVIAKANGIHVTIQSKMALPDGYRQRDDFFIEKDIIDKDSGVISSKAVAEWPIDDGWLSANEKNEATLAFVSRRKIYTVPCRVIGEKGFRSELHKQNLPVGDTKVTGEFFMAWFSKLRQQLANNTKPFGWNRNEENEIVGFAYGGHVWSNNDPVPVSPDKIDGDVYTPKGKIEPWKEAAKLITDQHRPELEVLFASAFAAPLVEFSQHQGWMLSAYSPESGVGKSSAMMVGCAVWGNVVRAIQGHGDTINALNAKMARLRNLPMFWDEGGFNEQTELTKFLLQITSGKEKDRLNQNAEARETHTWATLLAVASNKCIVDTLTSKSNNSPASLMRVVEFPVTPPKNDIGRMLDTRASNILSKLQYNYGQAGLIYSRFLGANSNTIASEMLTYMEGIEQSLSTVSSERFWLANFACTMLGAQYANQLELTEFDLDAMYAFLVNVFNDMRGYRGEIKDFKVGADIAQIVGNFISSKGRHIIVTDQIGKKQGPKIVLNAKLPDDVPFIHIGRDDNLMRIDMDQFETWLRNPTSPYKDNATAILKDMTKNEAVTKLSNLTSLGAGIMISAPRVKVLEFDLNKIPELKLERDDAPAMTQNEANKVVQLHPR